MKSLKRPLVLLLALGLAAALIAACGEDSDSGSDADPQQLLEETFSANAEVESGVLDVSIDADVTGAQGGTLSAALSGPFQSTGTNKLPALDMNLDLSAEGVGTENVEFSGGLTVTEDGAFINVDGTDYAVDDQTFSSFKRLYSESAQSQQGSGEGAALLQQLGIDPSTWLTDVTNEGTEEVGGVETVHISGTADIAKIVEDFQSLAEGVPGAAAGIDQQQLQQLEEAVRSVTVDVFTGADDRILRRLDLTFDLQDPASGQEISFSFSIGISEINEPQEITAPENAKPLEDLIPGGLGAAGGLGGLGGLQGLGGLPDGGGSAGGGGSVDLDDLQGANQKYVDCVNGATTPEEILDCARLLE